MCFCSAYWLVPLEKRAQDACGINAPPGVFKLTRVLHGLNNDTARFLAHVPECFQIMLNALRSWLDDSIIFADNADRLMKHFGGFLPPYNDYNLEVSAGKCQFFLKNVLWGGRIINPEGYHLNPPNIEAIKDMEYPTTADEQYEFIHCCE